MKEYKESDYAELKELCLELGIPYMESFIDIEYAIDQDKEPKHLWEQPQRCHSWVRNAYNQIMACLGGINMSDASPNWGTGFINIKDTGGTIRSFAAPGFMFSAKQSELADYWIRSGAGLDDYGILVGSSATPTSFEHYGMQTQLTTVGTTHAAMAAPSFAQVGLVSKVSYSRTLTNASGGVITYREVGLFAILNNNYTMLSRDLITPALPLNNTGFLTPTYTIALTYPS
jgi:hypothetical protein